MTTRSAPATNSTDKPAKKSSRTHAGKPSTTPPSRRWSANVTTVSTYPEHDLFKQDAETVAKHLASKKVSPKGPASGMRMLNFYINRAGTNLSAERHRELEKAKDILSSIIAKQKGKQPATKSATKKSAAKKSSPQKPAQKKSAAKKTSTHSKS